MSSEELSPEELQAASSRVASSEILWNDLLSELRTFGEVIVLADEVQLLAQDESTPHRFVMTANELRAMFVREVALESRRGDLLQIKLLPDWFITDLYEDIGSHENPYDNPFILLGDRGDLERSARPHKPAKREPGPVDDKLRPGGFWADSHRNRLLD